jgi:hypothetical protein
VACSPRPAVVALFCRQFYLRLSGRWPRLGRMYAGRGPTLLKWLFFGRILLTVGWCRVTALREGVFHIKDLDCWGPDMLIFHGEDEGGRPIRLLQHYSQLSVLLCAVPREKDTEPKIGFVLHRRLKEL